MNVKATTRVYGIFGHPVAHSLSPVMHNSAFQSLYLDCVYVAFDIQPRDLESAARAIKSLGIAGVNITIPHKESMTFFLDHISPETTLTGAVNTVKNDNGKLSGYNTDVSGFLRAIKEDLGLHPRGLNVVVLGAGGAARAVLSALCMNEVSRVYILNRTFDKAKRLASEFKKHFKDTSIEAVSLEDRSGVENSLGSSSLLVNATSAGMEGMNQIEIPLESLPKGSMVYDLVYKPRETELVKRARELGYKASGGLSMLLYQGVESFEIWTGINAPVEVMRKAIIEE